MNENNNENNNTNNSLNNTVDNTMNNSNNITNTPNVINNSINNNSDENVNNVKLITCSRCGKQYNINYRCCLDCGNVNPEHPANAELMKLIKKYGNDNKKKDVSSGLGNNMGNRKHFIIFNSIVFSIGFILLVLIPLFNLDKLTLVGLLKSNIPVLCLLLGLFELLFISTQIIFMKANHKWWHALIPVYNMYELCDIVFENGLLFIIGCIPVVGSIFYLVLFFKLGKKFDKNPILFMIFPFIYFPIVAFTSTAFDGIFYIDTHETNSIEKAYNAHSKLGHVCLVLVIVGLVGIFYTYVIDKKMYLDAMEKVLVYKINNKIDKIDKSIDSNDYMCNSSYTNADVTINRDGVYYFNDEEFFNNSLLFKGEGYIKLEINNNNRKYYIMYSDDNFTINNNLNTNIEIIRDKDKININKPEGNICSIDK